MKITLHTCEITRTRDTLRDRTNAQLIARMNDLRTRGAHAAHVLAQGEEYRHASNKGLATYTVNPAKALDMCRRDWALTRRILSERLAAG